MSKIFLLKSACGIYENWELHDKLGLVKSYQRIRGDMLCTFWRIEGPNKFLRVLDSEIDLLDSYRTKAMISFQLRAKTMHRLYMLFKQITLPELAYKITAAFVCVDGYIAHID